MLVASYSQGDPELSFEKWSSRPQLTSFFKYCFPRAVGARKLPSHVRDCGDNGACQLCDVLLRLFQVGCVNGRIGLVTAIQLADSLAVN